jgi:hypothetical protein
VISSAAPLNIRYGRISPVPLESFGAIMTNLPH